MSTQYNILKRAIAYMMLVGVIMMFFGCTNRSTSIGEAIGSFAKKSSNNEQIEIRLQDYTKFDRDRVLIFKYPTSAYEVEQALGIKKYDRSLDLMSGMIFVADNKVVYEEFFEGNENKTSPFIIYPYKDINQSSKYRVFLKDEAIFLCSITQRENGEFYRLYPSV